MGTIIAAVLLLCASISQSNCAQSCNKFQDNNATGEQQRVLDEISVGYAALIEPNHASKHSELMSHCAHRYATVKRRDKIKPTKIKPSDTMSDETLDFMQDYDSIDEGLTNFNALEGKYTIAEMDLFGLYIQSQSTEYSYMGMHHYSSFQCLKQAAGPQVNQEKCIRDIKSLNERLKGETMLKSRSKDFSLHRLLDTYGRMPSGFWLGNFIWEGSYRECLSLHIESTPESAADGQLHSGTRYCIAHLKSPVWPESVDNNVISIQTGVCLPDSCDSTNYKNKFELVGSIIEFNAREVDKEQLQVSGLYCLPDERSPMRSVWAAPRTLITLAAITCWLLVLAYATISDYFDRTTHEHQAAVNASAELLRSLSIASNLAKLFAINGPPSSSPMESQAEGATEERVVDLSIIEGIKVIAMCYVILGHVVMITTGGIIDGRRLSDNALFSIANMAPAFAVNSFFAITGILTSYLLFRRAKSSITEARTWLGLIVLRYIRIMPMYLFAVVYAKTIAKYTNSGPLWDYATAEQSPRRVCEQESLLWTLFFAANFKKPLDHCIPGGWYLANDFQFALVTPIFLITLRKYPNFGRKLILASAALGYFGCIVSILQVSSLKDMTPIAKFRPHGFKAVIEHLAPNYTRPQFRIPAYLAGLYIGHLLYSYEQKRLENRSSKIAAEAAAAAAVNTQATRRDADDDDDNGLYDWPAAFKRYCVPLCAVAVAVSGAVPFIASAIPFNKSSARLMVSVMTPSLHLIFSLATGLFVLSQATATDANRYFISKLFALPQWKPFSRLSLCALLVNVEVIIYIVQGRDHLHPLTTQYLWSLNLLAVILTYCAATLVCVLVETPARALINHLLTRSRTAHVNRVDKCDSGQSGRKEHQR